MRILNTVFCAIQWVSIQVFKLFSSLLCRCFEFLFFYLFVLVPVLKKKLPSDLRVKY